MAVSVQNTDVPKLMVGALFGAVALFAFIVIINHVQGRAEVGVN